MIISRDSFALRFLLSQHSSKKAMRKQFFARENEEKSFSVFSQRSAQCKHIFSRRSLNWHMRLLLPLKSSILQCYRTSQQVTVSLAFVERSENKINYIERRLAKRLWRCFLFRLDNIVAWLLFCAWFCTAFRSLFDGHMRNELVFYPLIFWKLIKFNDEAYFADGIWLHGTTNCRLVSRMHLLLLSFFFSTINSPQTQTSVAEFSWHSISSMTPISKAKQKVDQWNCFDAGARWKNECHCTKKLP